MARFRGPRGRDVPPRVGPHRPRARALPQGIRRCQRLWTSSGSFRLLLGLGAVAVMATLVPSAASAFTIDAGATLVPGLQPGGAVAVHERITREAVDAVVVGDFHRLKGN